MTLDLNTIAQAVTIALVVWAIKGIAHINGSVKTLMAWKDDHNKQDDERHQATIDWLKQLDRRNQTGG